LNTARSRTPKQSTESKTPITRATRPKTPRASAVDVAPATPVKRVRKVAAKPAAPIAEAPVAKVRKPRAAAAPKPSAAAAKLVKAPRAKVKAPAPTRELDERVRDAVIARLDAMKANDMKVIDVRGKTSVCDCLVIVSGTSTRHVKSMGDEVIVTAKKHGIPPLGIEGQKDAEWMLVDLGDTVVHLMLPKTREFYGLERLWSLTEESRAHHSAFA
jgi:ribosome silencing factor RsfS/YbeB/iojap